MSEWFLVTLSDFQSPIYGLLPTRRIKREYEGIMLCYDKTYWQYKANSIYIRKFVEIVMSKIF